MPGLSFIKILGNLKFFAAGLKLPIDWQAPSGDPGGKQYGDSIKPSEKVAVPQLIPPWFMPAEPNKYFQDSCDKVGKDFKDPSRHDDRRRRLLAQSVEAAGQVSEPADHGGVGHRLARLPRRAGAGVEHQELSRLRVVERQTRAKYRDAVAKGVSKAFKNWQGQVMVPGLPWYPAFAAFPGPMAPPMPNIPTPLIACPSGMMAEIVAPMQMKSYMIDALDGGLKDKDKKKQHEALFDAIATVLALAFMMWLPSQQVMLVLGKGPIPTFAPPFVPVGPVMGGDNISAPGHLMA